MRRVLVTALAATSMGLATPAAAAVVFTGSSGNLAASVTFDIVGGNLQVVLINTSTADTNGNGEVLQAVFFDIAGNPTLTYADADLTAGSGFIHTATLAGSGSDIGAEWAYGRDTGGLGSLTQVYGLSSAGYGIFGPGDVLGGAAHPDRGGATTPPDGGDFGLVSAGWVAAGDANGFINNGPHIQNSATFVLTGFNGSLSSISNIRFQYGTALTETSIPGVPPVPEPATWAMMLLGFGGIGMTMRRGRKRTLAQIA